MSFEVRRYDGAKYATVSSEGRTFDQVTGELVRKLLMYIGGSNEQGKPVRKCDLQVDKCAKICSPTCILVHIFLIHVIA